MIPKSKILTVSVDPVQRLRTEIKDLKSIQPLALRGEITTWQYDARNCIRVYYRMVDGNIWSRQLDKAVKQWAARLLFYSKYLGFTDEFPTTISQGRPNILQSYWWIINALSTIILSVACHAHSHIKIDTGTSFGVLQMSKWMGARFQNVTPYCGLYHTPYTKRSKVVCYRSMEEKTLVFSRWVCADSIKRLSTRILKATKRHRSPAYRKELIAKMEDKNYGTSKLRAGYRKA